ncbi:MAG: YidC/Oxa1 family membrane protein insertase [Clostridiales bacterium]|nr:YidC/Oxa1 family membrane protein insertase [Clostridiales bacterium]MDD7015889.1 YidC/Oxa1 family membrane protein insertase [Bacillota bacterium]
MYTLLTVIAKPLLWILELLYGLIGNYGIAIIVLTLIVKLCLYPLYIKQTKSMAKMSTVQPKMQALQNRYANDKEMLNVKMAELYKEEGFNPMSGCLPMIIQMPIIMGLFALLRNPLMYMDEESSSMIFAFHEKFLWIDDLSQPDKWILPIIAGVATFIAFTMNRLLQDNGGADAQAQQMNSMMKMMQYIFPLMILWLARTYPSGLSVYWAVSQIIQIGFNIHLTTIRKKIRKEAEIQELKEKLSKKK